MGRMIREMDLRDLDEVVEVHVAAFPGFFLTRMGSRFLRAYYQTVLGYEHSIALVAEDTENEGLSGFVVGFQHPEGFYSLFSARRRKLAPLIVLALLRDPALLGSVLRNTRRLDNPAQLAAEAVELSSIGVRGQSRGVGSDLLERFCEKALQAGQTNVVLTTDAEHNEDVRRFYENRDFVLNGYEDRGGRRLCHYARSLG
jgi:ribosomal protein S18 acetylase RimI-like enzyme